MSKILQLKLTGQSGTQVVVEGTGRESHEAVLIVT